MAAPDAGPPPEPDAGPPPAPDAGAPDCIDTQCGAEVRACGSGCVTFCDCFLGCLQAGGDVEPCTLSCAESTSASTASVEACFELIICIGDNCS